VPTRFCLLAGGTTPEPLELLAQLDERHCEVRHADGTPVHMTRVTVTAAGTPLYVQTGHWHLGGQAGSAAQWLVPNSTACSSLELAPVLTRLPAPDERLSAGAPFGKARPSSSLARLDDAPLVEALLDKKLDDAFKELRKLPDERRQGLYDGGLIERLSQKLIEEMLELPGKTPEEICTEMFALLDGQDARLQAGIIGYPTVAAQLAQGIAHMNPRKACEGLQRLHLPSLGPLFIASDRILQKWAGFRAGPAPDTDHEEDPEQAVVAQKTASPGCVPAAYQHHALAMMAVALQGDDEHREQADKALQLLGRIRRAKVIDFGPLQEHAYDILADHLDWNQPLASAIATTIFAKDSGLSHGFLLKAVEKYQSEELLNYLEEHPGDDRVRYLHEDFVNALHQAAPKFLAHAISVSSRAGLGVVQK